MNNNINSNSNRINRFSSLKQPSTKPTDNKLEKPKEERKPSRFESLLSSNTNQNNSLNSLNSLNSSNTNSERIEKNHEEKKNSRFDSLLIEESQESHRTNRSSDNFQERTDYNRDNRDNRNNRTPKGNNTDNKSYKPSFFDNREEKLEIDNASLFPSLYNEVEHYDSFIANENMYQKQITLDYSKIKESIQQEEYLDTVFSTQENNKYDDSKYNNSNYDYNREYGVKKKLTIPESNAFKSLWKMNYNINLEKQQEINENYDGWDDWYERKKDVMEYLTKTPYDPYMESYCEECDKYEAGEYDNVNLDEDGIDETLFNEAEFFSKKIYSE